MKSILRSILSFIDRSPSKLVEHFHSVQVKFVTLVEETSFSPVRASPTNPSKLRSSNWNIPILLLSLAVRFFRRTHRSTLNLGHD